MNFIEPNWPAPAGVFALSTLRLGGHSSHCYRSLNLGLHVGDDPALVEANREVLAGLLPAGTEVQWLSQVHGADVVRAQAGASTPAADACWSRESGQACAVLTADCLPVLLCSVSGDVVAAAHAGWRGLLAGVLEQTVASMAVAPATLMAWLGPAIGPAAFEVGPEVRQGFLAAADSPGAAACFAPNAARPGYYFADLYALARLRLDALGITRIFGGDCCTFSDSERFFSYRRDGVTGRMASVILLNSD